MVFPVSPTRLLVNVPVPVPSVVLLLAVVGFCVVDQHTPLAEILAPPSDVASPPEEAVVWVMEDISAVVTIGSTGLVLKITSVP